MPADELGRRVHDDVGAVLERTQQVRRRERVVDDERDLVVVGDLAPTPSKSNTSPFGLPIVSPKNALVFGRIAARHASRSSGSSMNVTSMPNFGNV